MTNFEEEEVNYGGRDLVYWIQGMMYIADGDIPSKLMKDSHGG